MKEIVRLVFVQFRAGRETPKGIIITLITDDGSVIREPKHIFQEEENFFKEICSSRGVSPDSESFKFFFQSEKLKKLNREEAAICEGLLSVEECAKDHPYQAKNSWWPGHEGFFSLRQSA